MPEEEKEGLPEYYVNGLRLSVSPFDVTIDFGLQESGAISETSEPQEVTTSLRPTVRIRISPHYALVLTKVLEKAMKEYQKKNGFLQVPRELLTKLGLQ